jgi:adenylyl- and sulfurtransferase ThiI
MTRKRSSIVRWTGRGDVGHLESSVRYLLRGGGATLQIRRTGGSVVVEGLEPLGVAAVLENTPGVSWVAAGLASLSFKDLLDDSASLARTYLKRGDRFSVEAEGSSGEVKPDVAGGVTSRILESVKGTRVSQENPGIRFRTAFEGSKGVVGVEVARGPGGIPTGGEGVVSLVSGGKHSSVVTWMALLAGYRIRLVHAKMNHESLLEAARLYAELSHRTDPRGLMLEVVEGESLLGGLAGIVRRSKRPVFGGFHAPGGPIPGLFRGLLLAPLYLLAEERFDAEFDSLSLKGYDAKMSWGAGRVGETRVRRFGGVTADVSAVIDGLA